MIDVHAHLFFDALLGEAGPDLGPRVRTTPEGTFLVTGRMTWPIAARDALEVTPEDRVAALDALGIDRQIVSISPLWLFHHAAPDVAEAFAASANDLMAAWSSCTAGRTLALAQLPVQRPDRAAEELRRCVRELGMAGAYIATDARQNLDDRALDPIYAACEELDVPLFFHAAMPGTDGPAGDPRLDRWTGHAVLGYPLEDTLGAYTFLFGDTLDRFPRLDVCFSHGGGAIPYLWGRLEAFAQTRSSPVDAATLRSHLERLWFDTHVHSRGALALLRSVANPDHLVFGSNFGGWDFEQLSPGEDAALITNARTLLRLVRD